MVRIVCALLAAVLGRAIFRKFNFDTLQFENTGLGILYVVSFIFFTVVALRRKKDTENSDK